MPAALHTPAPTLSRGLGWFSVALGVTELLAPRAAARPLGFRRPSRVPVFGALRGLRQLGTGLGLLGARRPTPWHWTRVAGDVLDLVALGGAPRRRSRAGRLALGGVVAVTALDVWSALRARRRSDAHEPARVERALTIGRPAREVASRLRDPEVLDAVLAEALPEAVLTRLGRSATLESTSERPDEPLRFRVRRVVPLTGAVRLSPAPGALGTEVRLHVVLDRPGPTRAVLRLGGGLVPGELLSKLLRRFKALVETGEIPTTARQPAARAHTH